MYFQVSLKLWNVPTRGQFTCSSTPCFTRTSKAQRTGATTSALLTKDCASAVGRTGATPWATTYGRKGSQKVENSFWKQEHACLSKVCGSVCYSLHVMKCGDKSRLCDPDNSFIRKICRIDLQTVRNPARLPWWPHIKSVPQSHWVDRHFYSCPVRVPQHPQHTAKPKQQHNCSGRPVKPHVPNSPTFFL